MQQQPEGAYAPDRRTAIAVLARADLAKLEALWATRIHKPSYARIRGPETGLVMIRGRAGGGGAPFNLGEASVTRATVQLGTGEVGHAYCLGRNTGKALLAAVLDALWQADPEDIEANFIAPLRQGETEADRLRREQVAATRVDFFTLVRGDD